jgi:hypothetical protein
MATVGLNVAKAPLVIPVPDHVPPAGEKPVKLKGGVVIHVLIAGPGVI